MDSVRTHAYSTPTNTAEGIHDQRNSSYHMQGAVCAALQFQYSMAPCKSLSLSLRQMIINVNAVGWPWTLLMHGMDQAPEHQLLPAIGAASVARKPASACLPWAYDWLELPVEAQTLPLRQSAPFDVSYKPEIPDIHRLWCCAWRCSVPLAAPGLQIHLQRDGYTACIATASVAWAPCTVACDTSLHPTIPRHCIWSICRRTLPVVHYSTSGSRCY